MCVCSLCFTSVLLRWCFSLVKCKCAREEAQSWFRNPGMVPGASPSDLPWPSHGRFRSQRATVRDEGDGPSARRRAMLPLPPRACEDTLAPAAGVPSRDPSCFPHKVLNYLQPLSLSPREPCEAAAGAFRNRAPAVLVCGLSWHQLGRRLPTCSRGWGWATAAGSGLIVEMCASFT